MSSSSAGTIFKIWHAIVGSSLLTLPWAMGTSSLGVSGILIIVISLISAYTSDIIFRYSREMQEELGLNDLPTTKSVFRHFLGPAGAWCGAFGLFILLGSVIVVFYCLLVKFLFGFVASSVSVYEASQNLNASFDLWFNPSERELVWNGWSLNTSVPFYCLLMIIPFCLPPKIMKYFYLLQPIGLINIAIMIVVILYSEEAANPEIAASSPERLKCEIWNFPTTIIGFLGAGVFVQNGIINLVKDNKNVENTRRDIYLAFVGVILVYLVFGYAYTLTFDGKVDSIPDVIYDHLRQDQKILIVAYFIGLIRMITATPILADLVRKEVFDVIFGNEWPGQIHVIVLNIIIILPCLLFSMYAPDVGRILSYGGGFGAMIYLYILPACLEIKGTRSKGCNQFKGQTALHIFTIIFSRAVIGIGVFGFLANFGPADLCPDSLRDISIGSDASGSGEGSAYF